MFWHKFVEVNETIMFPLIIKMVLYMVIFMVPHFHANQRLHTYLFVSLYVYVCTYTSMYTYLYVSSLLEFLLRCTIFCFYLYYSPKPCKQAQFSLFLMVQSHYLLFISIFVKGVVCAAKLSESRPQLCNLLVWFGVRCFISLCLGFLICKVRRITVPSSKHCYEY